MLFISAVQTAIELNESTFDSFIAAHEYVFVDFFTPWCDHCQVMKPAWDALSENSHIPIATVDCTTAGSVCGKFNIKSWPVITLFNKGDPTDYHGERDLVTFQKYLKIYTRNNIVNVTKPDLKAEIRKRNLSVYFVIQGKQTDYQELKKIFSVYPSFFFYVEAEQKNLVAYRDGFSFPLNISRNLTSAQTDAFVNMHKHPFIPTLTPDNIEEMNNIPGKTLVIIVDGNDDMEQLIQTYMVNGLSSLAFMKSFIFAKASQKYVYSLIREETAAGQLVFYNGRNPKKVKYGINTLEEGELRDELKKVLDHYDVSKLSVADKPTEAEGEEAREEMPVQKQEQKKEKQEEKKEDEQREIKKQSTVDEKETLPYKKLIDEELSEFLTKEEVKKLVKQQPKEKQTKESNKGKVEL